MLSKTQQKKEKIRHLKEQGDGLHRWGGALYEVKGDKYRQMFAESNPASDWRKLK